MGISRNCSILALAVVLLIGVRAQGQDITWTLAGVTFADGATANGTFTINPLTDNVDNWDLSVIGIPPQYGDPTTLMYTNTVYNQAQLEGNLSQVCFGSSTPSFLETDICLGGADLLTVSIADNPLPPTNGESLLYFTIAPDFTFGTPSGLTAGSLSGQQSATPEPATWFLLISGLIALPSPLFRRRPSR